ncbi:MAG: outer membrane protein assembly factor BamD [Gammaproteobacteria bacterium]|nr:outer membrane protein assembly factor BamD [Gammaproteobacteria bacterium]
MKSLKLLITTIFCSLILFACATKIPDPASMFPGENEAQLFNHAEQNIATKNYDKAVQYFETLDARYPFGELNKKGQLHIIYAYYKKDDYASAIAAADRYIRLYPADKTVDYAYYMRGLIRMEEHRGSVERYFHIDTAERDLEPLKKAFADFAQLMRFFPKSQYAPDARQRMIYIRNTIAKHNVEVAQFYYDRQAYVAAANRASDVVQHYQGAPAVIPALKLMEKSYRKLGLTQQADDAAQALKKNYQI